MSTTSNKPFKKMSFDQSPYIVLWELTRACGLACRHCRARAQRRRHSEELSNEEIQQVLNQLQEFDNPLIILTGGDPLERPDLFEIIQECKRRNFKVAITPSATPKVTERVVLKLAESGIERLAISMDAHTARLHDAFRRIDGSFARTLDIISWAKEFGIPVQINTSISKHNIEYFDNMHFFVSELNAAVLWSLFFVVPTGRAHSEMQITATQAEEVLNKMAELSVSSSFDVKATAAPQFRRVLLDTIFSAQSNHNLDDLSPQMRLGALRSYQSVNDGKGTLFISHTGDICPSGFLPLPAGNLRDQSLVEIYRDSQLFKDLRNPLLLRGKCGICRYKAICGGSRARAFAESGDYLSQDNLCPFQDNFQPY